ncbi:MAG: hypothetical protein KatS3mg082_2780 [Nitrospiraceae bacterium]|nr:MAG: hypothetical protein KatS3mg082_2780 [Nitrospiraceae bacterium]
MTRRLSDPEVVAQRFLRATGKRRVLVLGDGARSVAIALRLRGVIADSREGHEVLEAITKAEGFSLLWLAATAVDLEARIKALISRLSTVETVTIAVFDVLPRVSQRDMVEAAFISAGFRKTVASLELSPYATLDHSPPESWWVFERIPDALASAYPLKALREERDLHMDMTREAGRRSDAHLVRYLEASRFIRPGDVVLDVACGLGYGLHSLAHGSRAVELLGVDESEYAVIYASTAFSPPPGIGMSFRRGDAESLSFVESSSIDFMVSVETLEHLHHPDKLVAEAYRVLRPGGRLYVSVPNLWVDETGNDPNPFHHHVYDWSKLRGQLVSGGFIIERAWLQDAGGGMRRTHEPRAINEFDVSEGPNADGEWILALAIKPLSKSSITASARKRSRGIPNIIAFSRDYDDDALVKTVVSIGLRASTPSSLDALVSPLLNSVRPNSADRGALLCVSAYRALSRIHEVSPDQRLIQECEAYLECPIETPTHYRWFISIRYVLALIAMAEGAWVRAERLLTITAQMDPLRYSPLIATKTIGACVLLGDMALSRGKTDIARRWWRKAISECERVLRLAQWREVIGAPNTPETFGMPELAEVIFIGARAAGSLRALSETSGRAAIAWRLANQTPAEERLLHQVEVEELRAWIAQLQYSLKILDIERSKDREWSSSLEEGKAWLESQVQAWKAEAEAISKSSGEIQAQLREHLSEREAAVAWLEGQRSSLQAALEERAAAEQALREHLSEREAAVAWLEGQRSSLQAALEERAAAEQALREHLSEREAAVAWLEGQRSSLQAALEERAAAEQALREYLSEREAAVAWLEGQRSSLQAALEERAAAEQALREHLSEREAAVAWLEDQRSSLQAVLEERAAAEQALREYLSEREAAVAWLEGQRSSLQAALEERAAAEQALREYLSEREAAVAWLEGQRSSLQAALEERAAAEQALREYLSEREAAVAWLEGQRSSLQAALEERAAAEQALREYLSEREAAVAWLEGQRSSLQAALEERAAAEQALREHLSEREAAVAWLEGQRSSLQAALEERAAAEQALREYLSEREAAVAWLEGQRSSLQAALEERAAAEQALREYLSEREAAVAWLEGQRSSLQAALETEMRQRECLETVLSNQEERIRDALARLERLESSHVIRFARWLRILPKMEVKSGGKK